VIFGVPSRNPTCFVSTNIGVTHVGIQSASSREKAKYQT